MPWRRHPALPRHLTYDELQRQFRDQEDPWHFQTSRYEQVRFAKMLTMLRGVPHRRILEVGCAEGHFTARLVTVSPDVTAIDLSAGAIERAQARAPQAKFIHAKLEDLPVSQVPYDVVICGEMLYYLNDVRSIVLKLRQLGTHLLTSTCYPSALRINAQLAECRLLRTVFHMRAIELKAASIRLWEL